MEAIGVLPLFDPPREDAAATVATAGRMGVAIEMVTGNALAIARETARTLGSLEAVQAFRAERAGKKPLHPALLPPAIG